MKSHQVIVEVRYLELVVVAKYSYKGMQRVLPKIERNNSKGVTAHSFTFVFPFLSFYFHLFPFFLFIPSYHFSFIYILLFIFEYFTFECFPFRFNILLGFFIFPVLIFLIGSCHNDHTLVIKTWLNCDLAI